MSASAAAAPADLLTAIVAAARCAAAGRAARRPAAAVERAAAGRTPRGEAFAAALRAGGRARVIAECKRRSPSRGVIRDRYRPAAIAAGYADAGAAAISVLTEPAFFDGAIAHLEAVRAEVDALLLQKDFVVSEYQLLEARAAGADAVLLIAAALDDAALRALAAAARGLGLGVLLEVDDRAGLDRALAAGAAVIGVNSRNLRTFAVDRDGAHRLIEAMPDDVAAVAESGLRGADDVRALRQAGYDAFLIGEALMRQPAPGAALGGLLAAVGTVPRGARPARRGAA